MADGGIRWIQIRAKNTSGTAFYDLVERSLELLAGSEAKLWIDDRVDIAALLPVYGVHVGQRDLPPAAARAVLGPGCKIGFSTHDEKQLAAAQEHRDVDLLATGPIFDTVSKAQPDPSIGLDRLRAFRRQTTKALVAIGGINLERLRGVLEAGADSAVVLGAACLPYSEMKRGRITKKDLFKIRQGCKQLVRIAEM